MSETTRITDETLTAYLDGELSAEEAAWVEAELDHSAELCQRLERLQIPIDELRSGLDGILVAAPKMRPVPTQSARPIGRLAPLAAALALVVAFGGWALRPTTPDWVDVVANYQSLYVTDTLSTPPAAPEGQVGSVASLSDSLGVDLTPLVGLDTIDFRRAQMLGYNGAPLVQLAYLAGDAPIAICVTRVVDGGTGVETDRLFGMEAAYWTRDGYGYLVIGGDNPELIESVADRVRAEI